MAYVMPSLFFFFLNEIWVYDVISKTINPGLATVNSAKIVTVGFLFKLKVLYLAAFSNTTVSMCCFYCWGRGR